MAKSDPIVTIPLKLWDRLSGRSWDLGRAIFLWVPVSSQIVQRHLMTRKRNDRNFSSLVFPNTRGIILSKTSHKAHEIRVEYNLIHLQPKGTLQISHHSNLNHPVQIKQSQSISPHEATAGTRPPKINQYNKYTSQAHLRTRKALLFL